MPRRQGRPEEAKTRLRRALSVAEKTDGPEHLQVTAPLTSLGALFLEQGDAVASARMHERALAIRLAGAAVDAQMTGVSHYNVADALLALGRYDEALQHLEAAERIFAQHLPADHQYRVSGHLVIARALLGLNRPDEALASAEAALDKATDDGISAAAKLEVARALEALGVDGDRARRLATEARAQAASLERADDLRARIDAWLASDPAPPGD